MQTLCNDPDNFQNNYFLLSDKLEHNTLYIYFWLFYFCLLVSLLVLMDDAHFPLKNYVCHFLFGGLRRFSGGGLVYVVNSCFNRSTLSSVLKRFFDEFN